MKVLLTGACGFSGSHIAEEIVASTDWDIVAVDCLTYASHISNLSKVPKNRLQFIYHDFRSPLPDTILNNIGQVEFVLHAGAETHVTNSLTNPRLFVESNVIGTLNMLEATRRIGCEKFLYVSTDEVFGTSLIGHKEEDTLNPSNPYSASKAAGEMLVKSYGSSFGFPYVISRTTNIFGTSQHPEKFIPMVIQKVARGETIDIHADANGNIGSRQWIHASDQASALIFLLQTQANGTFHIAGERKTNLEIVQAVDIRKSASVHIVNAFTKYKGHDLHYALDDSKIRTLGWKPRLSFEEGLAITL